MKSVKPILALMLAVLMLCPMLALTASADNVSGDWTYTVSSSKATITKYNGSATSVSVPSSLGGYSVIAIAGSAFSNNSKLTSVSIPKTVTELGTNSNYYDGAFENCLALQNVTIAAGTTDSYVGYRAFQNCKALTSITIPGNYNDIKSNAFNGCISLTSLALKKSSSAIPNQTIKESCFSGCEKLTTVSLPTTLKSIGDYAFSGCIALQSSTIPEGVQTIGEGAFCNNTKLTTVSIPSTVTALGTNSQYYSGAFENCPALQTVTIAAGSSDAYIGHRAFQNCKALTSITIPGNYTDIRNNAFKGCISLTSLTLKKSSYTYPQQSISNSSFSGCEKLATVSLPTTLKSIGDYAFSGCIALKSLTIPEGVQTIGEGAFYNNTKLNTVNIPSTVTTLGTNSQYYSGAFENCEALETVIIENGDGETDGTIGHRAFKSCSKLKTIHIPTRIKTIESDSFDNRGSSLTICNTTSNCFAKTYATNNNITFKICNGIHTSTTYTITFNANGGSVSPTSATVTAGNSVTLPTPTKSYKITYNANGGSGAPSAQTVNLTCKGWSTSNTATSASYSCGANYKSTGSVTLYAVWNSPISATLSSTKPTNGSKTFLGWSTSSTATTATYVAGSSISLSGNITLYAVWGTVPSNYTLTYNANGSGVTNMPDNPSPSASYTISSTVPERFGYTFLGWSKSSSATSATYKPGNTITPTANITLYAVWKTAISISNDSSTNMTVEFGGQAWYYKFVPSSSGTYVFETTGSLDTHGYLYTSSSSNLLKGDDDSGSDYNFKIEYDLTSGITYYLKAKAHSSTATGSTTVKVYKKTSSTYTVTFNPNGGSVNPTSASVTAGNSVTLPTPTKTYKITFNPNGGSWAASGGSTASATQDFILTCKGWSTSNTATSASYSCGANYKPAGSVTLYAVWNSPISATLSSTQPTNGSKTFLGWSTSSKATTATYPAGGTISNLSGNITLYAVWKDNPTPSNAKLLIKTPKIILSTRWEALGVCAFTITGQSGNYNVTWSTADSSIVTAYNNATEIDDNVLGFTLSANNPGTTTITLKLYNNGNLLDTKTVNVEVIASYYTDSIRVRYNSYQSLNWNDGFTPYTFESDSEYTASVDEETGEVYGNGRGTTYIMAMDYYGNVRMVRVEVYYTLWQWIIMILLFGWIWY